MTTTTTDIVLPPVCYDILEASITKHGIGAGRYHTFTPHKTGAGGDWVPCCLVGHFEELFGQCDTQSTLLGIGIALSDRAVRRINARKQAARRAVFARPPHIDSRVTWEEYRDELRLLRGVLPHDFTKKSCDVSAHDSSVGCAIRTPTDLPGMVGQSVQRA